MWTNKQGHCLQLWRRKRLSPASSSLHGGRSEKGLEASTPQWTRSPCPPGRAHHPGRGTNILVLRHSHISEYIRQDHSLKQFPPWYLHTAYQRSPLQFLQE